MKKATKSILAILSLAFLLAGCNTGSNTPVTPGGNEPTGGEPTGGDPTGGDPTGGDPTGGDPTGGDPEFDEGYYEDIDKNLSGNELLSALRTLNSKKRTSLVGYKAMGTSYTSPFRYTDYDVSPGSEILYDENNQPYGTTIVSFYSGNTMTSFNKEHVWPKTHGGGKVEADIHMPRPTIAKENSSRGHSFFIEGMKSTSKGWDPAMEDFGDETYRGDSARIIFYCMVASNQLVLVDDPSLSSNTSNNQMGVISDMLSWNLRYPVQDREQRRNSGAEYLQGNRNPFIDHPEYACKIWGTFNDATKSVCGIK